VEIGGEISSQGLKNNGQAWIVAIEKAADSARQAQQLLPLRNLALATSGSYRNYFEEDGVRYSHTIDPLTGRPITHTLASVSVAAADCMSADAWATALMVLGPAKGLAAAEDHNIAALFIEKKASSFNETASSKWNSLLP
jgi:thiamine biosynthesis lipoprotein